MVKKSLLRYLFILISLVILIVFDVFGSLDFVRSLGFKISAPVVGVVSSGTQRVKDVFSTLIFIKQELDQNRELRLKVNKLEAERAYWQLIEQENQDLRKLLTLKQKLPYSTVAVTVISRDPFGLNGSVIINRGADMGLSPGDAVIDSSGALIGIINKVYSDNASFTLLTDGATKIDARVPGKPVLGVVSGSHGLGLSFDLVSHEVELENGDPVVTSGLTGTLPAGLLIGKLDKQNANNAGLFQALGVVPAADFKNFHFLLVITAF